MKTLRLFGLGIRLSLAGGRSSVARLLLVAVGLAVGVALLIGALSVGPAISARRERESARSGTRVRASQLQGRSATYQWNLPTTFQGTDLLALAVRGVGSDPPALRAYLASLPMARSTRLQRSRSCWPAPTGGCSSLGCPDGSSGSSSNLA